MPSVAVAVASCRACLAFHAPLTLRRRFGSSAVRPGCRSGLSRFGYLGQIPSVAYRGARSPPSFLLPHSTPPSARVAIYLIHCLETLNPPRRFMHQDGTVGQTPPLGDTKCCLSHAFGQPCHLGNINVSYTVIPSKIQGCHKDGQPVACWYVIHFKL